MTPADGSDFRGDATGPGEAAAGRPLPLAATLLLSAVTAIGTFLAAAADTFSMLASPARLHLVWLLSTGRYDVGELAERLTSCCDAGDASCEAACGASSWPCACGAS